MYTTEAYDDAAVLARLRTRQSDDIEEVIRSLFQNKALSGDIRAKIIRHKGTGEEAPWCLKRALIKVGQHALAGEFEQLEAGIRTFVLDTAVEFYYAPVLANDKRADMLLIVKNEIRAKGGQESDAEEALQAGVAKFVEDLRGDIYDPMLSSPQTYIVNKAKQAYASGVRSQQRAHDRAEHTFRSVLRQAFTQSPEQDLTHRERIALLLDLFAKMGQNCRQLLELYALGYAHSEIRAKLGLHKTDAVTRNAVHNCLDNLKQHFYSNPKDLDLLNDKT
jgi:hypothetical protein